jgi:excisionase family DNA binding protein
MMNRETLIGLILKARPDELNKVEAIFSGMADSSAPADRRMLTLSQAAREMDVSRMTVYRMCGEGKLATVETRAGRRRIPSAELTRLLQGKAVCHA